MKASTLLAVGAALGWLATGCAGSSSGAEGSLQVVVGFYPLQYLAERIGGPAVQVSSLAQPGAEPHDLELSPQQIQEVAEADLVLHLAGFQPAVDDAVAQNAPDTSLDVATATEILDRDLHVWLDPTRYAELAAAVADRMAEIDPGRADMFAVNAEDLDAELRALDGEFSAGLADCERTEIVTTHLAFGYLAQRYGLDEVGLAGLSPEDEPSPQDLDEARRFAEEHGVTTIFYEDTVSPQYAETVADQVGADTAVLSPVEVVEEGEDYFSVMRQDLATLRDALGCR